MPPILPSAEVIAVLATLNRRIGRLETTLDQFASNWARGVTSTLRTKPCPADFDEEEDCAVCYTTMQEPCETVCKHVFCADCLIPWLTQTATCPMCRHALIGPADLRLLTPNKHDNEYDKKGADKKDGCDQVEDHLALSNSG